MTVYDNKIDNIADNDTNLLIKGRSDIFIHNANALTDNRQAARKGVLIRSLIL